MIILSKSADILNLLNEMQSDISGTIYIYGARNAARRFYLELQCRKCTKRVNGFLVSSLANNPAMIADKSVYTVDDDTIDKDAIVIVTAEKRHLTEIKETLKEQGFGKIFYPEEEGLLPIYKSTSMRLVQGLSKGKYVLKNCESDQTYMKLSLSQREKQYYMVSPIFGTPYDEATRSFFGQYDFEREYNKTFGSYRNVSSLEQAVHEEDTEQIKIYMVTSHMNQVKWDKEERRHLIPIQAGAVLTGERYCEVTDDTGESISSRNQTLGEMTATYWVWKNAPASSYKGICHYRRHFQITESEYQAILTCNIDVIMCVPRFVLPNNVDNLIRMNLVDAEAVESFLKIVKKSAPEYYLCTEEHLKQNMFYPCNMLIAKEQVFNEYCEFMFSILLELDDAINKSGLKTKARCAAYLAELLTSVYFVYHKDDLKLAIADYQLVE